MVQYILYTTHSISKINYLTVIIVTLSLDLIPCKFVCMYTIIVTLSHSQLFTAIRITKV